MNGIVRRALGRSLHWRSSWRLRPVLAFALHVPEPEIPPHSRSGSRTSSTANMSPCWATAPPATPAAGGQPFAGGLAFSTPVGTIYSTNITPDRNTGIGDYSFEDFVRVMRLGVTPDGTRLYPAMPYTAYAKVSDEDLQDLFAYLQSERRTGAEPRRPSPIPWPLSIRWPLALWNRRVPRRFPLRDGWIEGRAVEPRRLSGPGAGALRHVPHASWDRLRRGGRRREEQPLSVGN